MEPNITVIESQVDWLTMAVHTERKCLELDHFAIELMRDSEAPTNQVKVFRLKGYSGWRCGRIRYGARKGAGLVQLSGDLAERYLTQLLPLADSLTRLDLAVTVHAPYDHDTIPAFHYHECELFHQTHSRAAHGTLWQSTRGGATFYLGDRTSDQYMRVYVKDAECRANHDPEGAAHYADCTRYEVEVKGGPALQVANAVAESHDRASDIQRTVYEHCDKHGLTPWFNPTGGQTIKLGFRRRTDFDSRMRWLDKSVKPTVAWLLHQGEAAEVLDAIGLGHLLTPGEEPARDS